MNTREKIQEIIGLIYDLNEKTKHEWFFNFSGHVKTVSVYYSRVVKEKCDYCGSGKEAKSVYLTYSTSYNGLNNLIKELKTYLPEEK